MATKLDVNSFITKINLLKIDCKVFGNTKSAEVEMPNSGALESRFRHNKKLLDSPELELIKRSDTAVKKTIDLLCSPFDINIRVAPIAATKNIRAILDEYQKVGRPVLVKDFINVYLEQYEAAKEELGPKHFIPSQYPSKEEMEAEFSFTYNFIQLSTPESLKDVDPELYASEAKKAQALYKDAAQEMITGLRVALHTLVSTLYDQLSGVSSADGKAKKLSKITVEKLTEALGNFDLINVTDDKELKAEVDKMKLLTKGVDVEQIRNSDNLRADLTSKFGEITKNITALIQPVGRKFRKGPTTEPKAGKKAA